MSDLLQAAKAAVERAEKQEAVGFEEWWDENVAFDEPCRRANDKRVWTAAQQAERERIRAIIKAVGVQGEHDKWFDACDKIMGEIDAAE